MIRPSVNHTLSPTCLLWSTWSSFPLMMPRKKHHRLKLHLLFVSVGENYYPGAGWHGLTNGSSAQKSSALWWVYPMRNSDMYSHRFQDSAVAWNYQMRCSLLETQKMCSRVWLFIRKHVYKLRRALCEIIKLFFGLSANYAQDTLARSVGQWQIDHEIQRLKSLDQICSFVLSSLHKGSRGDDYQSTDRLRPYASKVCRSVLLLCIREVVLNDRDKGMQLPFLYHATIDMLWSARDNYLDLLLSMDETILRQSLAELQTDRAAQFSGNLDRSSLCYDIKCAPIDSFAVYSEAQRWVDGVHQTADCCISCDYNILSHLDEVLISPARLSMIRFALGFLTILCNADIRGLFLREKISSFFMRLFKRLVDNEGYRKAMLGPLLTALAAAEKYFSPSKPFSSLTEDDGFWRLCLRQPCDNFHSNSQLYLI